MSSAPGRVHERALMLTCDEWLGVLAFPSVCATVGKGCPKWVRALCLHADATGQTVPSALLDALARGDPHREAADCDREAASVGEALGLCIVVGSTGATVRIMPTPFGFAVQLVQHVRSLELSLSEMEGAPQRTRVGVPIPARLEERRRLSAALPKVLPPSTHHDGPKALPPSIDHENERGGS